MSRRTNRQTHTWKERALSLLLAAVLLVGAVPGLTLPASAHWADQYLDQLVDWGVMRADQISNPDAPVTRADFAGIINRAYGYTESGEIPFEDVAVTDWFYDDIAIAYHAGYMAGTSETTASPNETLTREMAVCILARNMMMKESPGESLAFSDSRDVSFWARGMLKSAVDNYIISGYPDNSFGPQDPISKGQMAVLVSQCLGNPINKSGTYEMGGVFGNVTITAPNVTLRDTTISGDLYISGGVGLGGIRLENVNVLGRIIVSGTGESEGGDASVVMRNVTAEEMLVDNMRNKTVTVRADGVTNIAETVVRTPAYLEDNNTDDKGLMHITLDGEPGTHLTVAGRIKEVTNKTPGSLVQVAKGSVQKLTVDEAATNSSVQLDRNTQVKELNLDVATNVVGEGDIEKLNVNAPGCVVSMLPDKIYIRPGLNANINGVIMDHVSAEEGSLDPRLLSGYPAAKDIAPTGFRADFAGNKKGTVYWAVSSITDGSIGEDDLISPPSYGSKAIRNGSVAAPVGGTEVSVQVTGLTVGGSYYLSAILVDDQGNRSPVKSISFSTPDNTVPAFGEGYPYMSKIWKENPNDAYINAQVAVLATKTCRMFYAVLPKGAAAPTAQELKAAAVSGNLGYGVVDLEKNEARTGDLAITVSRRLDEQKDYVLYLWLTDVDGTNSSEVISLDFKTPDVTPPRFVVEPYPNKEAQETSVQLGATLNEDGTIFWVVVESGSAYPKPNSQNDKDNTEDGKTARLDSDYAKLQVANGMNAVKNGKVTATANKEANINITGLEGEKSYDLYYLAQDKAGNYTVQVYKLEGGIRTKDVNPPTVRQYFTKYDGKDNTKNPMRDTDIILEFSENVCFVNAGGRDLLSLYKDTQEGSTTEREEALKTFAEALRSSITFYFWKNGMPQSAVKDAAGVDSDEWAVDYEKARVDNVNGRIRITFPNEDDGLRLVSGGSYHFAITNIEDMSGHAIEPTTVDYNAPEDSGHDVPQFTVVFARIQMISNEFRLPDEQIPEAITNSNPAGTTTGGYQADFRFRMIPGDTSTVSEDISYDLLLWNDYKGKLTYDLYYRAITEDGRVLTVEQDENNNFIYGMPNMTNKVHGVDKSGWIMLGSSGEHFFPSGSNLAGKSLHGLFNQCTQTTFPRLNKLLGYTLDTNEEVYYEFIISLRSMGDGNTDPRNWSGDVNFYVDVVASNSTNLSGLASDLREERLNSFLESGLNSMNGGESIGAPSPQEAAEGNPRRLHMYRRYTDSAQPVFSDAYPTFDTTENSVTMNLDLDREGTVYYVIGYADQSGNEPADTSKWVPTLTTMTATGGKIRPEMVPRDGAERDSLPMPSLSQPTKGNIQTPEGWAGASLAVATGNRRVSGVATEEVEIPDLEPNRTYYVYMVITGSGTEPSEVQIYRFKTDPVSRPVITLTATSAGGKGGVNMSTDIDSTLTWILYPEAEIRKIELMLDSTSLESVLNSAYAGQLPAAYKGYSVYRALMRPYDYNEASNSGRDTNGYFPTDGSGDPQGFKKRYSVFDIYASEEIKSSVMTWLERGSVLAPGLPTNPQGEPTNTSKGTMSLTAGRPQLGATEAQPDTLYYLITMACRRPADANADDSIGLRYSFLGLQFQISDAEPPELTDVTGNFELDETGKLKEGGFIVLSFDKELYKEGVGKLTDVEQMFGQALSGVSLNKSEIDDANNRTTVTLILEPGVNLISGIAGNSTLTNSSGVPADKLLTISGLRLDPAGYYIDVKWGNQTWSLGPKQKPAPVDSEPPKLISMSVSFTASKADTANGTISLGFSKMLYTDSGQITDKNGFIAKGSTETPSGWINSVTVRGESNGACTVTLNLSNANLASGTSLKIPKGYLKNVSGYGAESDLELTIQKVSSTVPTDPTHYKVTATFGTTTTFEDKVNASA